MIGAARRASVSNTLSTPEQQNADHVASEADVRIRLLAVHRSGLAADLATHEIAEMKKNSVSFSFQAEQSLIDFRERMVCHAPVLVEAQLDPLRRCTHSPGTM